VTVVVAYGSEDQLADCLHALGPDVPAVVVDNARSEAARRICTKAAATYVRAAGNIGFAAAVNVALRDHRPPGSDVLLLNPDARLSSADLTVLQEALHRSSDLAAVGPRLVNPDGSDQKGQWPIPSPWAALAGVFGAADLLTGRRFISGAVLLLRGDAVDAIGELDERYFLYGEETDWQVRALREGWLVRAVPAACAIHLSGGTSSDPGLRELQFDASAERFIRKWNGALGWQVFRLASILAALRRLVVSRDAPTRAIQRRAISHYWQGPIRCADAAAGPQ
jgi:GT2 family glycosyltransferase